MSVKLAISKNLFTTIDEEDMARLTSCGLLKWNAQKSGARFYVSKNHGRNGKMYLHRFLMDAQPGQVLDHINGDSLDNRKSNLRFCSHRQNMANKVGRVDALKGVTRSGKNWAAQIQTNGVHVNIGVFSTQYDAARAYDFAAAMFFGEFAVFNFDFSTRFLKYRHLVSQ